MSIAAARRPDGRAPTQLRPVKIVADYLKGRADSSWSDTLTTPGPVQAATLLMLGHLHEHRGDDMKADTEVWEAIARLLMRFRDPALA